MMEGGITVIRFADVVLRLCYMGVLPVVRENVYVTNTERPARQQGCKVQNVLIFEMLFTAVVLFDYGGCFLLLLFCFSMNRNSVYL